MSPIFARRNGRAEGVQSKRDHCRAMIEQIDAPAGPPVPRFVAEKAMAWLEHNRLESSRPRNVSTRLTRRGSENRNGEDEHSVLSIRRLARVLDVARSRYNDLSPGSLRISAGKLEIREHEIGFRCEVDKKLIDCTISHRVLLDLAGTCGLSHQVSALAAFSELLSPIEKIASRKYEARRSEENGELKIGTADLLRYGFQIGRMRDLPAPDAAGPQWRPGCREISSRHGRGIREIS
jgi:uncharacterized protein DUF1488